MRLSVRFGPGAASGRGGPSSLRRRNPLDPLASLRSDFQGPSDPLRTPRKGEALFRRSGPVVARGASGPVDAVGEKRELFPGGRPTSPRSPAFPPSPADPNAGLSTGFPFARVGDRPSDDAPSPPEGGGARRWPRFSTFVRGSGSVDSRPSAVLAKPFSASALELLARTFATATEIRTGGRCAPGRPASFSATSAFVYSRGRSAAETRPPGRRSRRGFGRHRFSGPVRSAGKSLHTSWRVSTSVTTVPLSVRTDAFRGVPTDPRFDPFTARSVRPASPVLLTKSGPPRTLHFREGGPRAPEGGEDDPPLFARFEVREQVENVSIPMPPVVALPDEAVVPTDDGFRLS